MRKLNLSSLSVPALLITLLVLAASCARSPYSFVKVQPNRPFDRVTPVSTFNPGTHSMGMASLPGNLSTGFKAPVLGKSRAVTPVRSNEIAVSSADRDYRPAAERRRDERARRKEKKDHTRQIVQRELKKSSAFSALSAKKLEKVEKIISKQTSRIAEKKAASPASPIGFNQWMKIGVILLLVGLVVGIAFADLGYIVAVIGIVFLVLGLIQQL